MLPENIVKILQSENEFLQLQLQDVNEMIKVREEELDLLRKKAAHAVTLQSRLDMNQDEFYRLHDIIGEQEQHAAGAAKREASMETDLLQSIQMETEFYNLRDQFASARAELASANREMDNMASLYKEIARLTARVTELESNAEIAEMENGFLKEDLEKYRAEDKRGK